MSLSTLLLLAEQICWWIQLLSNQAAAAMITDAFSVFHLLLSSWETGKLHHFDATESPVWWNSEQVFCWVHFLIYKLFFFLFISPFLHPPVLQNVAKYESSISEGDGIWTLDTFFQMWIFCMSKSLFFPLLACIIKINGSLRCTGSLHGYISSPTLFTRVILYKRQQLRMLNCSPSATCSAHLSREEKLTLSTFLQP